MAIFNSCVTLPETNPVTLPSMPRTRCSGSRGSRCKPPPYCHYGPRMSWFLPVFLTGESSLEVTVNEGYSRNFWGDINAGWKCVFFILQINQYDVSAKEFDTRYLQMVDSSIARQNCYSVSHCGFRTFRLSIPTAPILMPRTAKINQWFGL